MIESDRIILKKLFILLDYGRKLLNENLEVKEDEAAKVGELGIQSIKDAGVSLNLNCPLDGEYKVGNNWSETH